jgi:hypothetical protein
MHAPCTVVCLLFLLWGGEGLHTHKATLLFVLCGMAEVAQKLSLGEGCCEMYGQGRHFGDTFSGEWCLFLLVPEALGLGGVVMSGLGEQVLPLRRSTAGNRGTYGSAPMFGNSICASEEAITSVQPDEADSTEHQHTD